MIDIISSSRFAPIVYALSDLVFENEQNEPKRNETNEKWELRRRNWERKKIK